MKKPYHIVNREEKTAATAIEQFAKANGQLLLPLMELITQARIAVDEVIGVVGRKTIETVQPNAYGLYDMLGNVWHGQRTGTVQPTTVQASARILPDLLEGPRARCEVVHGRTAQEISAHLSVMATFPTAVAKI